VTFNGLPDDLRILGKKGERRLGYKVSR